MNPYVQSIKQFICCKCETCNYNIITITAKLVFDIEKKISNDTINFTDKFSIIM